MVFLPGTKLISHAIEHLVSWRHLVPMELDPLLFLDTQVIVLRTREVAMIIVMAEVLQLLHIGIVLIRAQFRLILVALIWFVHLKELVLGSTRLVIEELIILRQLPDLSNLFSLWSITVDIAVIILTEKVVVLLSKILLNHGYLPIWYSFSIAFALTCYSCLGIAFAWHLYCSHQKTHLARCRIQLRHPTQKISLRCTWDFDWSSR
jgi:hypothetical protein